MAANKKLTVVGGKLRTDGCTGPLVLSPKPRKAGQTEGKPCCCECDLDDALFPCNVTIVHIDENRCEDDIFDLYVYNPESDNERFIQQLDLVSTPPGCCNSGCPQTRIDVSVSLEKEDFSSKCEVGIRLRLAGRNCCNTYTRFRIIGSNGNEVTGGFFGQGGYQQTFKAVDICGEAPAP
jgi:hypothetical protein